MIAIRAEPLIGTPGTLIGIVRNPQTMEVGKERDLRLL
jgi:hypothetical protein